MEIGHGESVKGQHIVSCLHHNGARWKFRGEPAILKEVSFVRGPKHKKSGAFRLTNSIDEFDSALDPLHRDLESVSRKILENIDFMVLVKILHIVQLKEAIQQRNRFITFRSTD